MTIEASGGWWVAAGFVATAIALTGAVVRAADWGTRRKPAPQPAAATPAATPQHQPSTSPSSPASNSTSGGGNTVAKKLPWGWIKVAAIVLAAIFVWYAWPRWIDPWLDANILMPRPSSTASDSGRSAASARRETVVYHRQVPDGGSVTAPAEAGRWSESISYLPGLRLCTVEDFGADTVAAQMLILGSDVWLDQSSLSRAQLRRVDQIRFRSLNGSSQNVAYSFVPFGERC